MDNNKKAVHNFWDKASCGENLYLHGLSKEHYLEQSKIRYELEPFIKDFAEFYKYRDKKVLEIGVGLGADHEQLIKAGAIVYGIDLTKRAVKHTKQRINVMELNSELQIGDAENLHFKDKSFDLVYSWGVLHHTPDTQKAIDEVFRVLKNGGEAKIMIYHKHSFVGYMLWLRYALIKLSPFTPLTEIYNKYLESPGTKAYTVKEALDLFNKFKDVKIKTILTHGDLLTSSAGQRHKGLLLDVAKNIWPRWIIKKYFYNHGLFMLITANK